MAGWTLLLCVRRRWTRAAKQVSAQHLKGLKPTRGHGNQLTELTVNSTMYKHTRNIGTCINVAPRQEPQQSCTTANSSRHTASRCESCISVVGNASLYQGTNRRLKHNLILATGCGLVYDWPVPGLLASTYAAGCPAGLCGPSTTMASALTNMGSTSWVKEPQTLP